MILRTRFVEASIINTYVHFLVFFLTRHRISKPVGVEYLPDESDCQEFGDLLTYGHAPLIVKVTQALFGGLGARDKA